MKNTKDSVNTQTSHMNFKGFRMYNNKDTPKQNTKQAKSSQRSAKHSVWEKPEIFLPENKSFDQLIATFENNTALQNHMFNVIVWYCDTFKTVYISQQQLANHLQCSRITVNRMLSAWSKMGLIDKMYRHMRTSLYRLSPIFYNPHVRMALQKYIPSFKNFSLLCFLFLCYNATALEISSLKGNVTQALNVYGLFINKLQNYHRRRTTGRSNVGSGHPYFYYEDMEFGKASAKREKMVMDGGDSVAITHEVLKKIKCMELTTAGYVSLMKFPLEALNYAQDRVFNYHQKINDPFRLFCRIASKYCEGKRLPINYDISFKMAAQLDIGLEDVTHTALSDEEFARRKECWNKNRPYAVAKPAHSGSKYTLQRGGASKYSSYEGQIRAESHSSTHVLGKEEYDTRVHETFKSRDPHSFSLEELRERNPALPMVDMRYCGKRYVMVTHKRDVAWRETTEEERASWDQKMRTQLNPDGLRFLTSLGITLPPAPLSFMGDCTLPEKGFYYVSYAGKLHKKKEDRDREDHDGR